jgi:hypothetical protein
VNKYSPVILPTYFYLGLTHPPKWHGGISTYVNYNTALTPLDSPSKASGGRQFEKIHIHILPNWPKLLAKFSHPECREVKLPRYVEKLLDLPANAWS